MSIVQQGTCAPPKPVIISGETHLVLLVGLLLQSSMSIFLYRMTCLDLEAPPPLLVALQIVPICHVTDVFKQGSRHAISTCRANLLCICVLQALRGVRVGQQGVQIALAALLLLLAAHLGQGTPLLSWNTAVAALGVVGALAMRAGLASLEKKFTYENYDHAK